MGKTVQLLAGEKQKGESKNHIIACNDYLRMGPGRSLEKLIRKYAENALNEPPSGNLRVLKRWSAAYGWVARAEQYDAMVETEKNIYRQQVMQSGLALDYERVVRLKELADFLVEQLYEQGEDGIYHNVWLPDVKQIGAGDTAERVDIERFNAAIISEFRSTLDDLAKEVGGRKVQNVHTGKDGGPIQHEITAASLIAAMRAGVDDDSD